MKVIAAMWCLAFLAGVAIAPGPIALASLLGLVGSVMVVAGAHLEERYR